MILVIDNFDSFTHNLVQYLGELGAEVLVRRNDAISLEEIVALEPEGILLSPGPCTPAQSRVCLDISRAALAEEGPLRGVPLFGVCLGHQAIGEVAGGTVGRAERVMHGKSSLVTHDGRGVFADVPSPFEAIRYHSLVVLRDQIPEEFEVSAWSQDDGEIMGMRHRALPVEGVQFHPESVNTQHGMTIMRNFARTCGLPV
jgi:anthranilate synthase/aminodeoxychorismate synthase-like glutamine amidotransferase